jgi:hypothetical protein
MPITELDKTCCAREKYWYEMEDKQKIEKLQFELERTQNHLKTVSELVEKLYHHEHLDDHMVSRIGVPGAEQYSGLRFHINKFVTQKP